MKKPKKTNSFSSHITSFLAHRYFFYFVLAFFAFQMVWIALSTGYPMLFDEEYHIGIIDIYSHQIGPFMATQPPEAAFHADITRYHSYLFHYLMSLPYSLISYFTDDLMTKIILLRLLCITIVLGGLVLWRKVLIRAKVSRATTHIALLLFTLIPLVPFALSQVNYDSLFFTLIPLIFYLSIRSTEKSGNQSLWLLLLLSVSALGCLTKFTMLPIAVAAVLFTVISLLKQHGKKVFINTKKQFQNIHPKTKWLVSLFFILSVGLFVERYGVNIALYKNLEPACEDIHAKSVCIQNNVWRRNTTWKAANSDNKAKRDDPYTYTKNYWAKHIFGDFFVTGAYVYETPRELEIRYLPPSFNASGGNAFLRSAGWIILFLTIAVTILTWRAVPQKQLKYLIVTVVLLYGVSLWLKNYTDYLNIGVPLAAQGRYFVPLLVPIFALSGLAFSHLLKKSTPKLAILAIFMLILSQGGGVASYILYSKPNWYWAEGRQQIESTNKAARDLLRFFVRT